jgi:thioredoxin reductase (NADPH)
MVVGGGDSAMEEANFLTRFGREVALVHRRDSFRASKIMLERVRNHPKIEMLQWLQPVSLGGEGRLDSVTVKDTRTGEQSTLAADGLFLAIGHIPQVSLFEGQLQLTEHGYIKTDGVGEAKTATSIEGVFACGDVADHRYRQAATSAGSGCMAAIDAEHYLSGTDA